MEGFAKCRYSFQGQEHDDEIKGKGNSVNYKYRMHDPRIGRFFAVDPLASDYPWNSVYAFSENMVIHMVELEGLEASPAKNLQNKDRSCINVPYVSSISDTEPPNILDGLGTVGTLSSITGYFASMVPLPQFQGSSKILIGVGEAISIVVSSVEIIEKANNDDPKGATLQLGIEVASHGMGKIISKAFDKEKITQVDKAILNISNEVKTEIAGKMIPEKKREVSKSTSKMGTFVSTFQQETTTQKKTNSKSKVLDMVTSKPLEGGKKQLNLLKKP